MAEPLHISITVAGQKDLNDAIGRINAGTYSINDMTKANQGLKESLKEVEIGSSSYKELQTAVATTETGLKQLRGEMKYGSQGYAEYTAQVRAARQEKRMMRFAIMEVIGGLEGLATAYGALTGAEETEKKQQQAIMQGFQSAIAAAFGLKFGLEMVGVAANIAGPVAIAVGALTLLGSILSSTSAEAKRLAEEMKTTDEKINDMLLKTGGISSEQYINLLSTNARALRSQAGLVKTTKKVQVENYVPGAPAEAPPVYETQTVEDTAGILERNKLLLSAMEAEAKIADLRKKQSEEKKKYDEESLKLIDEYWKTYDEALLVQPELHKKWADEAIADTKKVGEALEKVAPKGRKTWKPGKIETDPLAKEMGLGGENIGYLSGELGKAKDVGQEFTDSLGQGMLHATSTLAQGFITSFGLGNSLLGSFAASMLSVMSEVGVKALIGKGLSMIPGLGFLAAVWPHAEGDYWFTEPTYAVGLRSGQRHLIAEREPEHLANMNQLGANARLRAGRDGSDKIVAALRSIDWRMKGLDMVAVSDRNLAVRNSRLW